MINTRGWLVNDVEPASSEKGEIGEVSFVDSALSLKT